MLNIVKLMVNIYSGSVRKLEFVSDCGVARSESRGEGESV